MGESGSKGLDELQQMRLDMTKELRLMREDLKQAITSANVLNNQAASNPGSKLASIPIKT